ncbi:MAG: hypothetical protein IJJ84_08105 [Kiritimatiellae bacterium]|nr:hypothetical protein [Kiritimatiellia bacterium]
MNKSCKLAASLSLVSLVSLPSPAAHIRETMTLAKGWNAIYLESTPTNAACADFFAGSPVARVASYHSDAYSSTRQIADDGTEIAQKPISYHVWVPGDETASTMDSLVGGRVYLIYATNTWTKENFLGVPAAPQQTWRATSGETGFMNLVGVSADKDDLVAAKAYFGEGPFGTSSGVAYQIGGTNPTAPTFLPMTFGSTSKLHGGKAYALTATKDGDWPGVIGFSGVSSVAFGSDDFASVTLKNFGTTNHTFRVTIVPSADATERVPPMMRKVRDEHGDESWTNVTVGVSWDVELAAEALGTQKFAVKRADMTPGVAYSAVMQIEDLGGTQMRVRIPVTVEEKTADEAAFPTGLWAGYIQMETVSSLTNETPTAAAGTLKMNILVHVPENGTPQLLQRVAAGVDSAGNMRLFKELSSAKTVCENPRRLSSVMMSVANPIVDASAHTTFGDQLQFAWTVDANARDNPFRHAWHPDHDGKTADYSGDVVSGDDLANYVNPVKPELWSVTNTLYLSWHKRNIATEDIDFEHNPNETTAGFATWTVGGLLSSGPIYSMGIFYLKRIAEVGVIED